MPWLKYSVGIQRQGVGVGVGELLTPGAESGEVRRIQTTSQALYRPRQGWLRITPALHPRVGAVKWFEDLLMRSLYWLSGLRPGSEGPQRSCKRPRPQE